MKTFFKVVFSIVVIFGLLFLAQAMFKFSIVDIIKSAVNSVKLKGVTTNTGEEIRIPVFQIVSLEVFYPSNIGLIEADVFKILGLEFGSVVVFFEYDSYVKFGVRNPETIKISRIGDTLYVDESTIIIELLDVKINNYRHINTFGSNPTVRRNLDDGVFLQALNVVNKDLEERMIRSGQANFEFAKNNFKENYKNMCKAIKLEVVWEHPEQ
jgi:hypothetical protein